jgi:hypothetical protein
LAAPTPSFIVGGCIVAQMRTGTPPQTINDAACKAIGQPPLVPIGSMYQWAVPFLELAFDNVEAAMCGSEGCATTAKGRAAQIIIVADGFPNATTSFDSGGSITIAVSSGFIDFVESAAFVIIDNVRNPGAMDAWLDTIDRGEQQSCSTPLKPPWSRPLTAPPIDGPQRVAAQTVFEFIFGHELAHSLDPFCGVGAHALSMDVEKACDATSTNALTKAKRVFSAPALFTLLTVSHYLSVRDQFFGQMYWPNQNVTLHVKMPPTDFVPRTLALAALWDSSCTAPGAADLRGQCAPGWKDYHDAVVRLAKRMQPGKCGSAGPAAGSVQGAATTTSFCSAVRQIVQSGDTQFKQVRGAPGKKTDEGDEIWPCSMAIPTINKCDVWHYKDGDEYNVRCEVDVSTNCAADRKKAADLVNDLKGCYPAGWTATNSSSGTHVKTSSTKMVKDGSARIIKVHVFEYASTGTCEVTLAFE